MALSSKYPYLFGDTVWPMRDYSVTASFISGESLPPASMISNVNVLGRMSSGFVIVQLACGLWELPGGTLEPGEHFLDAARRELLEEAGAILRNHRVLGAWRCWSSAPHPYRSHISHPECYRVVLMGDVEVIGQPTNPPDGEQIVAVEVVSASVAAARFTARGRPEIADLFRYAASLL